MLTERTKQNIRNGLLLLLACFVGYYVIVMYITMSQVKHIVNLYTQYLITTQELTEQQTESFKDNIKLLSRCIHKNFNEHNININNLNLQTLISNIAKYNIHCDEKQLAVFKFLKKYYRECNDDIIIEYVKKNIGQGKVNLKIREVENDFDDFTPIEKMNIKLFITDQSCVSSDRCIKDKDCDTGKICSPDRRCTCPPAGFVDCSGTCKYVLADKNNCGACGVTCGNNEFCNNGICYPN